MTTLTVASPTRTISTHAERDRLRASFALALEAEGASAATRRVYGYAVRTLFSGLESMGLNSLPASATTAEHIRHVLTEKQRGGSSPGTVNTIHRGLRRFFAWLCEEGERADNPMLKIAAPAVPEKPLDAPSREQIVVLIAHCKKDQRKTLGARDAALLMVMASTGLRAAEMCALRVEDIDLKARLAVISGKGRKVRPVPFEPSVLRALTRYWRLAGVIEGAAFCDRSGKPLSTSALYLMVRRRGSEIGIEKLHPHLLRHTWATAMLEAELPEQAIRVLAGWSPGSRMLQRYSAHQAEALAVEARRRITLVGRRPNE